MMMTHFYKRVGVGGVAMLLGLCSSTAHAQFDISPPLPNVLLLVDSSGSMEYMADGKLPKVCSPTKSSDLNRWGTLITVLTGTVNGRGCARMNRSSAAFKNEFALGGAAPYDGNYHLPHHRVVSNGCVKGPGNVESQLASNPFSWPDKAIAMHSHANKNASCGSPFDQIDDGLLDVFRDRVRFGLMTFDGKTASQTGLAGNSMDASGGMSGMWSYYLNWRSGGTPTQGNPPNCKISRFEVGARNAAAPPWEGRMISMGAADLELKDVRTINDQIQDSLLVMRPYGATPLAALMTDAYTFLRLDGSKDPLDPANYFGPAKDAKFWGGCRDTFIILLSDGEPNLDLRPYCEKGNGKCPYKRSYDIAKKLSTPPDLKHTIKTFAIGFGLSKASNFQCGTLKMPQSFLKGGKCDGAKGALRACCTLSRIAYEGGTNKAYFADNLQGLKSTLSALLSNIAAGTTSRTMPVFAVSTSSTGAGTKAAAAAYDFTSSFQPGTGDLWSGNLERNRWLCRTKNGKLVPELQPVDAAKGDDFAKNVNQGKLIRSRRFMTVIGHKKIINGATAIDSKGTIRPELTGASDGLGTYTGTPTTLLPTAKMADRLGASPLAMGMSKSMPAMCSESNMKASSAAQCARRVMNWQLGGKNPGGLPTRQGREFGAIFHATPAVHGQPEARIRDPSYKLYAQQQAKRALMLYAVTTDGQLHAFKVAPNDAKDKGVKADKLENNELWSFMPPYVLPKIAGQYDKTPQILLDGSPVVRDVFFERTLKQAIAGGSKKGAQWRTVLVAGGRGGGGFYYALDVTEPLKPKFLWQISSSYSGQPLFGRSSGTPAITTISLKDGQTTKQVSVAILPGGEGRVIKGKCKSSRKTQSFSHIDPKYKPRNGVHCWEQGPGRSLTVVRLSDGKVLMRFQRKAASGPSVIKKERVKNGYFDSPVTGIPVPYPSGVGQIADRVYVGDADGTMWRVDLSSPIPKKWDVDLLFDAYPLGADNHLTGQPIETRPVISVDGQGNTVLLFSTGGQDQLTSNSAMRNRVWSIREAPQAVAKVPFKVKANWYLPFEGGKRATGPIALFDKVAYFSSYTPRVVAANACSDGCGSIWGVDYIKSKPTADGPRPLPKLAKDPNANKVVYVEEVKEDPGTIVYGVAVSKEPSCYNSEQVNDSYVGSHAVVTEASPPVFALRYQTGTGGTANTGAKTKAKTRILPTPRQSTKIDSWASIVE
jgi:type IV pilus assembly protein PilY1